MAWYSLGTVALSDGSDIATGSGVAWSASAIAAADSLVLADGRVFEVSAVISGTSLRLARNYSGAAVSGMGYAIQPTGVASRLLDLIARQSDIQDNFEGYAGHGGRVDNPHAVTAAQIGAFDDIEVTGGAIDGAGIGLIAPADGRFVQLQVDGAGLFSRGGGAAIYANREGANGAVAQWNRAGVTVGSVYVNDNSTSYITTSDHRLKKDVKPLANAIDIIRALRPVTYIFKADGEWMDGFIAHEFQEFLPGAVSGEKDAMRQEEYEAAPALEVGDIDPDGVLVDAARPAVMAKRTVPDFQGMDYGRATPILTAALQDALDLIDAQAAGLAALRVRVFDLESAVTVA
jgi:hypothetical protein